VVILTFLFVLKLFFVFFEKNAQNHLRGYAKECTIVFIMTAMTARPVVAEKKVSNYPPPQQ
jgi:hypothetical protein